MPTGCPGGRRAAGRRSNAGTATGNRCPIRTWAPASTGRPVHRFTAAGEPDRWLKAVGPRAGKRWSPATGRGETAGTDGVGLEPGKGAGWGTVGPGGGGGEEARSGGPVSSRGIAGSEAELRQPVGGVHDKGLDPAR